MKGIVITLIVMILIIIIGLMSVGKYTYLVEIEFCDNRKPIRRHMKSKSPPENYMTIETRDGVPKVWVDGEKIINVCNVRTIKKIDEL